VGYMARSLIDLLAEELHLKTWQVEERSGAVLTEETRRDYLEGDCLVHNDWIDAVVSTSRDLPRHDPPFTAEMGHWMLQPSCGTEPELPWKRVHMCMYRRPNSVASSAQRLV
jgi:hypothetical protein